MKNAFVHVYNIKKKKEKEHNIHSWKDSYVKEYRFYIHTSIRL